MQSIVNYINEGRISTFEIKKYVKSAITNSTQYEEYNQYLKAVLEGINEGIVENLRYYKEQKELEDTEKFSHVIDDFMELFKKVNK